MTSSQKIRPGILLAFGCLICLSVQPLQAYAHDKPDKVVNNEKANGDTEASAHDIVQGAHVEGHIAFLKTELGITPAQELLWGPVASAMREDVRLLQEAERRVAQKPRPDDAIEYLQNRVTFADLRAEGEARFLTALQPLYNALSPQQRQITDELLIPDNRGHYEE